MTKAELKILERAFEAEIADALDNHGICHLLQTKSKLALKLVEEGYLNFTKTKWRDVEFEGYELTHLGRLEYCSHGTL